MTVLPGLCGKYPGWRSIRQVVRTGGAPPGQGTGQAFAAFPDLGINIDHMYWNGNEKDGYNVATRWTFQGTHEGPGIYGEPTGKRVQIMVISHQYVRNGKFVKEWTVFDEFVLLKQLYTPEIHGEFE